MIICKFISVGVIVTICFLFMETVWAQSSDILIPCTIDGVPGDVFCGTLSIDENPALSDGRTIDLEIAVLSATGVSAEHDPVFVLTGGPGQSAIRDAARYAGDFSMIRERRALVLVDQRGTGGSNPLACSPSPSGEPFTLELVRDCRLELEQRADLAQYSTVNAAHDLEAVRKALGFNLVNLDGGSYGTRVALVYMKLYPDRVRTAVLRGVSPTNYRNPLPFAAAGQKALEKLFADCAADEKCNRAYPELSRSFLKLLKQLIKSPVTVQLQLNPKGSAVPITLTRDLAAARLHLMLYSPELSSRIPFLIHEGAHGNFNPLATFSEAFGRAVRDQIYFGMQLSVVCSEDIPAISNTDILEYTSGTFLGASLIRRFQQFCKEWPAARLPSDFRDPVTSAVPVLLISGDLDPATPPDFGEAVVKTLPAGRHLIVPQATHIIRHPCLDEISMNFVEAGTAEHIDVSCIVNITRPAFFLNADNQ